MLIAGVLAVAACGGDADTDETGTTAADDGVTADTGGDAEEDASADDGEDGSPDAGGDGFAIDGEFIIDQETFDAGLAEGTLSIYTVSTEEAALAIAEQFTADTGIETQVFRAPGSELTQRILAESDGGVHAFDIVALTSPAPYDMPWLHEGLLVPDEIADDHAYYPLYAYLFLIAANTGVLGDDLEITTWEQIVDPQYRGKLGITPAGVGGTGLAQAAFQRDVLGEEYWTKLGEVDPVIFSTTATVAQSLAAGEISIGVVAESAIALPISEGAPVALFYPQEGVIGGVTYQAVSSNASSPNAAKVYQAWSLALRGQNVMATRAGTRGIRENVAQPEVGGMLLRSQDEFDIWWADLPALGAERDTLVPGWNAAVGYTE